MSQSFLPDLTDTQRGLAHLWAGWRSAAFEGSRGGRMPPGEGSCVFCRIASTPASNADRLVLAQDEHVAVLMNLYPYTSGHVLISPVRHVGTLAALTATESEALWEAIRHADGAIRSVYEPDGTNIGINQGPGSGASIPDHLHVHVLPRWAADTNFMTAVADTRVMIETVQRSYEKLADEWV